MTWPLELRALIEADWTVGDEFVLADLYGFQERLREIPDQPAHHGLDPKLSGPAQAGGWIEAIEPGRYRRLR